MIEIKKIFNEITESEKSFEKIFRNYLGLRRLQKVSENKNKTNYLINLE